MEVTTDVDIDVDVEVETDVTEAAVVPVGTLVCVLVRIGVEVDVEDGTTVLVDVEDGTVVDVEIEVGVDVEDGTTVAVGEPPPPMVPLRRNIWPGQLNPEHVVRRVQSRQPVPYPPASRQAVELLLSTERPCQYQFVPTIFPCMASQ